MLEALKEITFFAQVGWDPRNIATELVQKGINPPDGGVKVRPYLLHQMEAERDVLKLWRY